MREHATKAFNALAKVGRNEKVVPWDSYFTRAKRRPRLEVAAARTRIAIAITCARRRHTRRGAKLITPFSLVKVL
jgi:hypothetical protein